MATIAEVDKLIQEAYDAMLQAEVNEYPLWDWEIDDIVKDLMLYHQDFEDRDRIQVKLAVAGALGKHNAMKRYDNE